MPPIESFAKRDFCSFADAVEAAKKVSSQENLLCVLELVPNKFSIISFSQLTLLPTLQAGQIRLIVSTYRAGSLDLVA